MKGWFGKLRAQVPASIAARGTVLMVLVAGSVAVPGLIGQRLLAEQERERHRHNSEAFLALALAARLDSSPGASDNHTHWLERVSKRSQRVLWAGVFDLEGGGLEFRRRMAIPLDQIAEQIDLAARQPRSRPLLIDGVRSERFELLTIPQPEDGMMSVVILDQGELTSRRGSAALVWLAGLMLVGLGVSWAWFQFGIEEPIRKFAHTLARVQREKGIFNLSPDDVAPSLKHTEECNLPLSVTSARGGKVERPLFPPPSELTGLAHSVANMQGELQKWRVEATCLRHSIDAEVEGRTRRATRAQHRAERDADTDALTRLDSRRVLERDLPGLFEAQQRAGRELSIVMLDVDNFKRLNDSLGHQTGDQLLAFVGDLIRATIRKGTDRAVRYGGDEFVLVLPDTTASEACSVAERLVALFAQWARTLEGEKGTFYFSSPGESNGKREVALFGVRPERGNIVGAEAECPVFSSLSAGVASLRQHSAGSWELLLRMADEAMYWAKQRGRGVGTIQDARL